MGKEVSNWWQRQTSKWWYLVPIFLGLIGGLIAYVRLKNNEPEKAVECFCIGGIITCLLFFAYLIYKVV